MYGEINLENLKVLFIPNLGDNRTNKQPAWGAEFFAEAFRKHSKHYVTVETSTDNVKDYDVIWVHNIANLLKGVRGRLGTAMMLTMKQNIIIGGVRGEIGFDAARHYLSKFDALHTSNYKLTQHCKQYNLGSFTLSSGVPKEWYQPHTPPKEFIIGWAGDPKKNMKNVDLLDKLGYPVKLATKENYIPNHEMPKHFYNKISCLVHPSSHEGSCRVITEAAACAVPILCTDVGHNHKIVSQDWMFDQTLPVYKIKRMLSQLRFTPDLARKVGLDNQENARKFSWPMVIEKADKIIQYALDGLK